MKKASSSAIARIKVILPKSHAKQFTCIAKGHSTNHVGVFLIMLVSYHINVFSITLHVKHYHF